MAELDPRTALEHARTMRRYIAAFDGQKFDPCFDEIDRRNLAVALDNLEDTAAMLLNMAGRVAASPQPTAGQQAEPTDALVKALEDCLFHLEADMGKFHPVCVQAREALASRPSEPAGQVPLTLAKISDLARDAQIAFCLDKHPSFEVAFARAIEAALARHPSERPAPEGRAVGERELLIRDAQRMDMLETCNFPNRWIVAHNEDSFTVYFGSGRHATRKTLREAIDAASQADRTAIEESSTTEGKP